jgi:Tol biopolymer transport system component
MRRITGVVIIFLALALPATAQATFPGENGKIVHSGDSIWTENTDGSGGFQVTAGSSDSYPKWSPDGQRIVFSRFLSGNSDNSYVVNSDGTGLTELMPTGVDAVTPDWSPDGRKIVFQACAPGCWGIYVIGLDGSGLTKIAGPAYSDEVKFFDPKWSPDGTKIAFTGHRWDGVSNLPADIYTINPDGTGLTDITNTPSFTEASFDWSPDGSRIVFDGHAGPSDSSGDYDIYVMNRDGSGRTDLTPDPASFDSDPLWAPDGSRILFHSTRSPGGFFLMKPDGTSPSQLVGPEFLTIKDWQPVLRGYARPKGATPLYASLVPAFTPCASPNRVHAPPLSFGSCAPPAQTSPRLTVGTPDANSNASNSTGHVRLGEVGELPINLNNGNQSDVTIDVSLTDVRNTSNLSDYTGELRVRAAQRITDRNNTPYPGGPGPATVSDTTFGFTVPCAATLDTTVGSTCALNTTANTLVPNSVIERQRAVWQLGQIDVYDGGPDGDGDTFGDNTLFMTQGVFAP